MGRTVAFSTSTSTTPVPMPTATSVVAPLCPLLDRCARFSGTAQTQGSKESAPVSAESQSENNVNSREAEMSSTAGGKIELNEEKNLAVIDNAFDDMISFRHLEQSYHKARKKKQYRREVLAFTADLDANLHRISDKLAKGKFVFGPYRRRWVYVPKKRLVMALPFDGRVVQWAIYLTLNPFFDRMMIEDSYACRENKGALAAVQRLQYWMKIVDGKDWYILKLDISKYFYRVDHAVLIEILRRRIKDERLMNLLVQVIDANGEKFGLPRFASAEDVEADEWLGDRGMPIGNLTSQMFANIYLNELDQYCKHCLHIHYYIRYMDDIVILVENKEKAQMLRTRIEIYLSEVLHLDVNSKTSVMPVGRAVFVGYEVTAYSLQLRKQTVRRIKSSFRCICRRYFVGELTRKDFDRRVASYSGMMKPCECASLRFRLNQIYIHAKEAASHERVA